MEHRNHEIVVVAFVPVAPNGVCKILRFAREIVPPPVVIQRPKDAEPVKNIGWLLVLASEHCVDSPNDGPVNCWFVEIQMIVNVTGDELSQLFVRGIGRVHTVSCQSFQPFGFLPAGFFFGAF